MTSTLSRVYVYININYITCFNNGKKKYYKNKYIKLKKTYNTLLTIIINIKAIFK